VKARTEARLRRLERVSAGRGRSTILVVEELGDENAFESFRRGLMKIVIATGVPRADREVSQ
jgi:hypothetical protein